MVEFIDLIGALGFPIVAFLLMYRMANTTIKENTAVINELNQELRRRR